MTFSQALERIREGSFVTRKGWNGKGMYVGLQKPNALSSLNTPFIYIRTVEGQVIPWVASQSDLLANDWEVVF